MGYYGGVLPNHNHSTTAGDGGQLNTPTVTNGPIDGTTEQISTKTFTMELSLLTGS